MDKSITAYYNDTRRMIDMLEDKKSRSKAEELYFYHIERVRDFQHERFIHLLVTFFFSGLLILSIFGLLWTAGIDLSSGLILTYLFGGAGVLLFVTVLFYIRHYYRLENGVQKLYILTERLSNLVR